MKFGYGSDDAEFLKYLEERIAKNPSSALFAMLSYSYLGTGKIAEALSVAQRGVIAHPGYSTGHIVLAMAMMKARLFYDARKELVKASELKPGSRIVETLTETLDKEEQADEIGRKLAEQFQKNRAGGKDLMKTIEETIEAYRPKDSGDDFIIPGLDAIIGDEREKLALQFRTPTLPSSRSEVSAKHTYTEDHVRESSYSGGKGEPGSPIAKEIIERVAREFESKPAKLSERPNESHREKDHDDDLHPHDESAAAEAATSAPSSPESSLGKTDFPAYESDESESGIGDLDLDSLARELEAAGPIKPHDDQVRGRSDESGIELTPEIVTDTLAMIFEQQGQLKTAIEAYNILIQKKPEQAETYKKKIAELTQRANG